MTKHDYNAEPVHYCSHCLSLSIKELYNKKNHNHDLDLCLECGCTDINEASYEDWNKLYVEMYGQAFLTENLDSIVE